MPGYAYTFDHSFVRALIMLSRYAFSLLMACLTLPAGATLPAKPELPAHTRHWTLHADGYGPITVGMRVDQAEKLLGVPLLADGPSDSDCYHVAPGNKEPALMFMVRNQRISRVSLFGHSSIHTEQGLQVGDREQQVWKRLGRTVKASQHAYGGDDDHYLTWWRSQKPGHYRGIRFETSQGKVAVIHAGDDSIELIEGCS